MSVEVTINGPEFIGNERLVISGGQPVIKEGFALCEDHGHIKPQLLYYAGRRYLVCESCVTEHCEIGWVQYVSVGLEGTKSLSYRSKNE